MRKLIEQLLKSEPLENIKLLRDFDENAIERFGLEAPARKYRTSARRSSLANIARVGYTPDIEEYKDRISKRLLEDGVSDFRHQCLCFCHESVLYRFVQNSYPFEYEQVTPDTDKGLFEYAESIGVEDGKFFTCTLSNNAEFSTDVESALTVAEVLATQKSDVSVYTDFMEDKIQNMASLAERVGSFEEKAIIVPVQSKDVTPLCDLLTPLSHLDVEEALDIIVRHLLKVGMCSYVSDQDLDTAFPTIYNKFDGDYVVWNPTDLSYYLDYCDLGEIESNLDTDWSICDTEDMVFLFARKETVKVPYKSNAVSELFKALTQLKDKGAVQ